MCMAKSDTVLHMANRVYCIVLVIFSLSGKCSHKGDSDLRCYVSTPIGQRHLSDAFV